MAREFVAPNSRNVHEGDYLFVNFGDGVRLLLITDVFPDRVRAEGGDGFFESQTYNNAVIYRRRYGSLLIGKRVKRD